jgi:tetratricopeptide (TPR) repeat protein
MFWDRGQAEGVREHITQAEQLAADSVSASSAYVLAVSARFLAIAGADERALEMARNALELAEQLGLDELRAHALTTVGMAKCDLGDGSGLEDMERALEIALAIDSPVAATTVNNLGVYGTIGGDIVRADAYYHEARRLAERFGDGQTVRFVRTNLIWAAFMRGRWDEARTDADSFIAECEAGSPHTNEWMARNIRASLHEARGEYDQALADNRRALELAREAAETIQLTGALGLLAVTHAERGELAEAGALVREAVPLDMITLVSQYGAHGSLVTLAPYAEELGIASELRAAIDDAPNPAQHRWPEAILLGLDGDLTGAADFLAEMGSPTLEARLRMHAGERFLRDGRQKEGVAELQRALAFYAGVEAPAYVTRIEHALDAAHSASA